MKKPMFPHSAFFTIFIILLISNSSSTRTTNILLEQIGQVEFSRTSNFKCDLTQIQNKANFISVQIFVPSNTTNQLHIYTNFNSEPKPDKIEYTHKTNSFAWKNTTHNIYQLDYSPCEISNKNSIHIQIVGVEGKTNYVIIVNEYNDDAFTLISCLKPNENEIYTKSRNHIYKYNFNYGIVSRTSNLEEQSVQWDEMSYQNNLQIKLQPMLMRIKPIFLFYKDVLYLYGGYTKDKKMLNDMWIFDINLRQWKEIVNEGNVKFPYANNGEAVITHNGMMLFFGYTNDKQNDIKLYKIDTSNINDYNSINKYKPKVLYEEVSFVKNICQYSGYNLIEIKTNTLLLFGGTDQGGNLCKEYSIISLDKQTITTKILDTINTPKPRIESIMIRVGTIVYLYGGKNIKNEQLNELWKYNTLKNQWIPMSLSEDINVLLFNSQNELFYQTQSNFLLLNKQNNFLARINLDLCQSDTEILSDKMCIPCPEGTEFSKETNQCIPCQPGYYFNYEQFHYNSGKCIKCPNGSYNPNKKGYLVNSCSMCPFGTIAPNEGSVQCLMCSMENKGELCLSGSEQPITNNVINEFVKSSHISKHYPEFYLGSKEHNNIFDKLFKNSLNCFIIISSVFIMITIIYFLVNFINNESFNKTLLKCDFVPLTGGSNKKTNGGLISLTYYLLIFIAFSLFMIKYLFFNQAYEYTNIPMNNAFTKQNKNNNLISITLTLVSNEIECDDNEIKANNETNQFVFKYKSISSQICEITITIEDINMFITNNNNTLYLEINNKNTYLQLIKSNITANWNPHLHDRNTYSQLVNLFLPTIDNEDIQYNNIYDILEREYVFKGNAPIVINYLLTDVNYQKENDASTFSKGYLISLKSFVSDNSVKSTNSFLEGIDNGVILKLQFDYNGSLLQVVEKEDISIIEVLMYMLGIIAGLAFICRIMKFLFEKCNFMDYNRDNFENLTEEMEDKVDDKAIGSTQAKQTEIELKRYSSYQAESSSNSGGHLNK